MHPHGRVGGQGDNINIEKALKTGKKVCHLSKDESTVTGTPKRWVGGKG